MAKNVTVDDRPLRKLLKRLGKASKQRVKIGVLKGSGRASGRLSMVHLAAIHEFGSPAAGIPERSFIRRTFNDEKFKQGAAKMSAALAKKIMAGMTIDKALNLLGAWAQARVKLTITAGRGIPPPLKPATIARKKSKRPLVHHGRLINAITWKVS